MKKFNIAQCIDCTKAEYTNMTNHYNNTLYACYDTGELFKGNTKLGSDDKPEPTIITVNFTQTGDDVYAGDKTYQEIADAVAAGKDVIMKCYENGNLRTFTLYDFYVDDENITVHTLSFYHDGICNYISTVPVADAGELITIAGE